MDRSLLQRLDLCRPASDDAAQLLSEEQRQLVKADGRYAEWQRRSAEFDGAVAAVFGDVPVPEGLSVRLRAALAQDAAEAGLVVPVRKSNRRTWLAAAGSALTATAAGWALFAWLNRGEVRNLSDEDLMLLVLELHQRTDSKHAILSPISRLAPPADLAPSGQVVPQAEPRWRKLDVPLAGRNGIVYELAAADAPRASLYVVSLHGDRNAANLPQLSSEAPRVPRSTGGNSVGSWTENNRLYVLVVEGDLKRYSRFLERQQPVA